MKINVLDKIFKYIYIVFLSALLIYVAYFMTVLVISPKKDLQNRGFIVCTKQLVLNLGECESGHLRCVIKAFYNDTACNFGVICDGFANWLKGAQPSPWANYIFEPQLQEESDNPYLNNPQNDMENMTLEREFMRKKLDELETIKNKALKTNETVITSDPETETVSEEKDEIVQEIVDDQEQNIDDEVAIGEFDSDNITGQKIEPSEEKKLKSDSEKIAAKARKEVLKQGE